MINTVFFDFDGTLINTNDVIIESWQHTYNYYLGHEVPLERITAYFGEPLLITMAREFPGVDPAVSAEVYRDYQRKNADRLVKIFPEIKELLEALREKGYRIGIVTSRTRVSANAYLEKFGIEDYFDDMVTCDDTEIHKPNPEPLLLAMEKMGVTKEESIMVGDGAFDIKCANNAGVKSVLVGWRITGESALIRDAEEDFNIEKPLDLLDILKEC